MTAVDPIPVPPIGGTPADWRRLADACDALAEANHQLANAYREAANLTDEHATPPAQCVMPASELVVGDRWRESDGEMWHEATDIRPTHTDPTCLVLRDEFGHAHHLDVCAEVQVIRPQPVTEQPDDLQVIPKR